MDYDKNVHEPIARVPIDDSQPMVDSYHLKNSEIISNEHNREIHGDTGLTLQSHQLQPK